MWVYITLSRCTGSYGTQRMTVGDHRSAVEACVLCWLGYRCAYDAQGERRLRSEHVVHEDIY
jgi:hypothetical protein